MTAGAVTGSTAGVRVAAVDLGASSGRVMTATVAPDRLDLVEAHRFANAPVRLANRHGDGSLHWDIVALYREVLDGLHRAGPVDAIGVDSWGVDYGLLDARGSLVGNPFCYRDTRTDGVMEKVQAEIGAADLYATTGIQNLPFNTLYQLVAARETPALRVADRLLLVPDLLTYWLTGVVGAEVTNASTTQLLDAETGDWAYPLIARLGLPVELFPPLHRPGTVVGPLSPQVRSDTGLPAVPVVSVGSHDTASAVVGVPATDERFAYISCGTWSLVGVELTRPVLTEASRRANFTNEVGVDGTIRYLRNVMGLWLLQECLRAWPGEDLPALLQAAESGPAFAAVVDPDDSAFLAPGDMPRRIADACRRTGQPAPATPAALVRCIVDSLALAHRRAVRDAMLLSGQSVDRLHLVGGGSRNPLLCQLTADACGLPVIAGPVEATAYGSALVQARALGAVPGALADLRALLVRHTELIRYEPRTGEAAYSESAWAAAESRLWP
jgi:sugar (pentulose or hexulose) kinase